MKTISYKEFQTEMAQTLQRVVDDHSPIVITQANGRAAVLMSLEDFNAYGLPAIWRPVLAMPSA